MLGEDVTNAAGRYNIKYEAPKVDQLALRVIAIDAKNNRLAQSAIVLAPQKSETVDLRIPIAEEDPEQEPNSDDPADDEDDEGVEISGTALQLLGNLRTERDFSLAQFTQNLAGMEMESAEEQRRLLVNVLRARGYHQVPQVKNQRQYIVAGVIDREGPLASISISVVSDQLDQSHRVLGRSQTNSEGEFSLLFEAATAPIIKIVVSDAQKRLYVSPPRRARRENWFEWSSLGTAIPHPGMFELREPLLASALESAGLKLEDLDELLERVQITLLAETTGISRGHVALHVLAAKLEKTLGNPPRTAFRTIGSIVGSENQNFAASGNGCSRSRRGIRR